MGNQDANYSFATPKEMPLEEVTSQSIDYAKQVTHSVGMVQYMINLGALMVTMTLCSSSPPMETESELTFNLHPDSEIIQRVMSSLQHDDALVEESKRESWKVDVMALAQLTDNWDEEGAQRVSTTAIKHVLNLLDHPSVRVDLLQDIYANPNGTVSVEWESDNHEYAGVQIGRKQMSYYVTRHQGSDYCNFEYINEESYSKLLAKLALL